MIPAAWPTLQQIARVRNDAIFVDFDEASSGGKLGKSPMTIVIGAKYGNSLSIDDSWEHTRRKIPMTEHLTETLYADGFLLCICFIATLTMRPNFLSFLRFSA
jgi:hypothetical protein